jgi:hypothetical protein
MRRFVLIALAMLCISAWGAAIFLYTRSPQGRVVVVPTLMVLPSLTPTPTASATSTPPETSTDFPTQTATVTVTPSLTATLTERLLVVSAAMPGVSIVPTTILSALGTIIPAPPNPVEPLIDATRNAPPFMGWFSFESDYPTVHYDPPWIPRLAPDASRGQYHRTDSAYGVATFAFEGEGLRIRYVAATNMGIFEIVVDGVVIDTIDAYADTLMFPGTQIYFVGRGSHLLQVRATGRKNNQSDGTIVGLDAVQVYRGDANTVIIPPPELTTTPTPTPQDVAKIDLISAPPTIQPTATPIPPRVVTASVVIAYDENSNRAVDPAEGVAGISVRVVDTTTNQVVASGFTDENGYLQFQVVIDTAAQIVVPYFGKVWALQAGNTSPVFTLLLNPGNQPGLIP